VVVKAACVETWGHHCADAAVTVEVLGYEAVVTDMLEWCGLLSYRW